MNHKLAGKLVLGPALILVFLSFIGCWDRGPRRYEVSGTVTYAGKPVPEGSIAFEPDPGRENSGPSTVAIIKNGRYCTPSDKGAVTGPHVVKIYGFKEGARSEKGLDISAVLFPVYYTKVDLPPEKSTQDFAVPFGNARR